MSKNKDSELLASVRRLYERHSKQIADDLRAMEKTLDTFHPITDESFTAFTAHFNSLRSALSIVQQQVTALQESQQEKLKRIRERRGTGRQDAPESEN